jgi:hypothetical protein
MDGKLSWHRAALLGVAALIMGCEPDATERSGANQTGLGDGSVARDEARQAPGAADRDGSPSIRPPTTTTSPAAPHGARGRSPARR